MKKKGFTLIELLAVIVILAVIAVIATTAVLNIIEDSKKSAAEASARNIVSAAKTYYMQNLMEGETISNIDLSSSTLKYDVEQATKGLLSYDKSGNAYGKMYISGYCIEVASDGTITNTKTDESECDVTDGKIKLATPLVSYDATTYNFIINKVDNVERYDIYNENTKIASIDSNGDEVGTPTITTVDTGTSFIITLATSDGKTRLNTAIPDECNLKVKAIAPLNSKAYIDSDFSESIQVDVSASKYLGTITLKSCDMTAYVYDGKDATGKIICTNKGNIDKTITCDVTVTSGYVYASYMKGGTNVTINGNIATINKTDFSISIDTRAPCAS